ncbi:MAG: hypothetical protein V1651_02505 [Patescibacteria group bacterium]
MSKKFLVLFVSLFAISLMSFLGSVNAGSVEASIKPILVGSYKTPNFANGVYISGNYAYVASKEAGLQIIDISNPKLPIFVGSYNASLSDANSVYVSGSYAYVANGIQGLQIIDVSNPKIPMLIGNLNTLGYIYNIYVSGNYAYASNPNFDFKIIDISNPKFPILISSYILNPYSDYHNDNYDHYEIYFSGNYAYVVSKKAGLRIIDISNPTLPILVSTYNVAGGASKIYVSGNYAYIAGFDMSLYVVDISNAKLPTLVGNCSSLGYARTINIFGNYIFYATNGSIGIQMVDVSNRKFPNLMKNYNTEDIVSEIYISGNYAYVANGNEGLQILEVTSTVNKPFIAITYPSAGTTLKQGQTYTFDWNGYADPKEGGCIIRLIGGDEQYGLNFEPDKNNSTLQKFLNFTIPKYVIPGSNYKIELSCSPTDIYFSDKFSITKADTVSDDNTSDNNDTTTNTSIPDLDVVNLKVPDKATLGSDVLVKATIKDLNFSNPSDSLSYSITTSIIDAENNYVVIDERKYNGENYEFNIPASKFRLGENTIIVQVDDLSDNEEELENNSLSKTININRIALKKLPYRDGVLLISKITKRVYLIENKMKRYLDTLAEFKKYRKNKIYRVNDTILNLYPEQFQNRNGVLFIDEDTNQTYLIKNKTKDYIDTLEELKKYKKNKIYRVNDAILDLYSDINN